MYIVYIFIVPHTIFRNNQWLYVCFYCKLGCYIYNIYIYQTLNVWNIYLHLPLEKIYINIHVGKKIHSFGAFGYVLSCTFSGSTGSRKPVKLQGDPVVAEEVGSLHGFFPKWWDGDKGVRCMENLLLKHKNNMCVSV